MLIGDRKNADNAFNRFRGVNGVQGGENEVAGFRCFESDFNRSRSRISPTRMTFGAWRSAARRASANVGVSLCSSR